MAELAGVGRDDVAELSEAEVLSKEYLFVDCLRVSRYAFVEASPDMRQDSWFRARVAIFASFGGSVPRLVPENLKTGVIFHPREGEVVLNNAYREMAVHSAEVLPGRVRARFRNAPSPG